MAPKQQTFPVNLDRPLHAKERSKTRPDLNFSSILRVVRKFCSYEPC